MLLWYTKTTGDYVLHKSPSSYRIDWEDLDANSYRSVATGNLIDTVVSKKWSKISMEFNCLTEEEVSQLMSIVNVNPIYAKVKNPIYSGGYLEAEFRVSKASSEMLETGDYTMSFNLVQKKKVAGQ